MTGETDAARTVLIRVALPAHLRTLARISGEVELQVSGPVTQGSVLDALEARYPMLRGTIRDQRTGRRRAFIRFFACELSHEQPDDPLPGAVASGAEPYLIVGAMAGG
jgi:molybdopterin converting factor small subunit